MKESVALVLLNWNGLKHLQAYLPQVVEQTKNQAAIVVIDNGSTDYSIDWISKHFPAIEVIRNKKNLGFAGGYNEGLKQVKADIYVLMNTDVVPEENYLEPVLNLLQKDAEISACQPKIKSLTHPKHFEYAGAAGGFIDPDGYTFCRGRIFDTIEPDEGQYDDTREIFWASGACLFIRATDFHEAGGFDSDFFAHMEEIDLCWRLKNTGKKIYYCAESTVYHLGGGTLNYENKHKAFLNFRNNLFLLYKNYRGKNLFGKLMKRLLLDGAAAFKFLVTGQPKMIGVILRAHFSFYSHLGVMRGKRKSVKIKTPNNKGIYTRSILWNYFWLKKRKFTDLEIE